MTVRFPPGRHLGQSQAETPGVSGYQTPAQLRDQAATMAVVLNQPHRRGNGDARCESVLWVECQRLGLRDELYEAGERYGVLSAEYKATIDIRAMTEGAGTSGFTDEEAQNARAKLAKDRYWACLRVLRGAHQMAQGVVERVCYDKRPAGVNDDRPLRKGLYALAMHLQTINLGINQDKKI